MKNLFLIFLLFSPYSLTMGQKTDGALLFQKNEIEVTKNNSLLKKYYFEILINNRHANELTQISIPYSSKNKIKNLQASIKDINGTTIRTLKKNEITDKSNISDISLYEDNMIKEFVLVHNEYPYIISYSYEQEEKHFLYVDYWIPVLDNKIPTIAAELHVTIPLDYPILISQGNINEPEIVTIRDKKKYSWKAMYTNLVPNETLSPPITDFLPFVKITPENFKYEKDGSFRSWTSFGNWEATLLKGLNDLPKSEKARTDLVIQNISDKREKIKALYHYLQDVTRYINVSIDRGGLKPYPASYVAANKYGDCKALTNYMKAVLENYDIPSLYTNIYASETIRQIDKTFPSQQFNHVILTVPLEHDTIWLDCTSKGPFNYLGTFSQNRDAFAIDQDNSHFLNTPSLSAEDVISTRNITVELSDNQQAKITYNNLYRGKMFEMISQIDKTLSKNDQKKVLQQYITGNKEELSAYEILNKNRDDTFVQLRYITHTPHIFKTYGNDMLLSNVETPLPPLETPENRILPVQINFPVHEIDTLTYILPAEYTRVSLPANQNIRTRYGSYSVNYTHKDRKVIVSRTFLMHSGNYEVDEYKDFHSFIDSVKKAQSSSVITLNKN